VTREGAVVGLYAGMRSGGPLVVPIDLVRAALEGLTVGTRR
jgi:hypothetical protein